MLPKFKYNPNCYENGVFSKVENDQQIECQCCGQKIEEYYLESVYCRDNVEIICPKCVADGTAAEKYNGTFIQDAESIENSIDKTNELFCRTPGMITWQGEYWLSHCNDYCAFVEDVGTKELEEMGIADEVFADYAQMNEYDIDDVRSYLVKKGNMSGYLFRCLHCGKYRIWVDAD